MDDRITEVGFKYLVESRRYLCFGRIDGVPVSGTGLTRQESLVDAYMATFPERDDVDGIVLRVMAPAG